MKRLIVFVCCVLNVQMACAEKIGVSLARSDAKEMEQISGTCTQQSASLVCNLDNTIVRAQDGVCKVSTRRYSLELQQQSLHTWGMWHYSDLCGTTEVVTIELPPNGTKEIWPNATALTIKTIVERQPKKEDFCNSIKNNEELVFTRERVYEPQSRICKTIQFDY